MSRDVCDIHEYNAKKEMRNGNIRHANVKCNILCIFTWCVYTYDILHGVYIHITYYICIIWVFLRPLLCPNKSKLKHLSIKW